MSIFSTLIKTYGSLPNAYNEIINEIKNKDSKFTARITSVELSNASILTIDKLSVSSFLTTEDGVSYGAQNLTDGNIDTSWQEGANGFGKNETITLQVDEEENINYLVIYNGSQINNDSFTNNNRVKDIIITVNGTDTVITLEDTFGPQTIELKSNKAITFIKLSIDSVYDGLKYNDTCISEIQCYK